MTVKQPENWNSECARGAAKEKAIGIDPKYKHSAARRRDGVSRAEWVKASAKWDLEHRR